MVSSPGVVELRLEGVEYLRGLIARCCGIKIRGRRVPPWSNRHVLWN